MQAIVGPHTHGRQHAASPMGGSFHQFLSRHCMATKACSGRWVPLQILLQAMMDTERRGYFERSGPPRAYKAAVCRQWPCSLSRCALGVILSSCTSAERSPSPVPLSSGLAGAHASLA